MTNLYAVNSYHGELFLKVPGLDFATLEQVEEVIKGLQATAERLLIAGDQATVKAEASIRHIRRSCDSGIWDFDIPPERWPNFTNCVYFVSDPRQPNAIKIGKTVSLKQRMKAYRFMLGADLVDCIVLGVVSCNDYAVLERSFHEYLQDYQLAGEWFDINAVKSVLSQIRQIRAK